MKRKPTIRRRRFFCGEEFCPLVGDMADEDVAQRGTTLPWPHSSVRALSWPWAPMKGDSGSIRWWCSNWKEVARVSKQAFKKQLTGKRPGALALQFINDTLEPFETVLEPGNKYRLLSEALFTKDHALMLIVTNSIELSIKRGIIPYRPDAHQEEYCKLAAFYNERYDYPISQVKALLDP